MPPPTDADWDDYEDDEDYVYVPEDRGIARKLLVVALTLFLVVFLVLGAGGYWLYSQVNPGEQGEEVALVIPKDAGLAAVSNLLEDKGVVSNATIFRYYAKYKNIGTIKAGEYDRLYRNEPMDSVIDRLQQGPLPPKFTQVTVPEGLWLSDAVAKILTPQPNQQVVLAMDQTELGLALQNAQSKFKPGDKPVEGFLFPATYRVEDGDKDNEQKLVTQMTQKFDQVGDEIGLGDAPGKLSGFVGDKLSISPYEAVVIASLIEAEAKVPEDRPRIARVIYNRLQRGMKLEIDASVLYALGEHKTQLTKSDLDTDSPYNTRKYGGLPPTPINSPGKDSLLAALNPSTEPGAETWLYYVLIDAQGHHLFTGNYNEFLRAADKARQDGLL